MFYVFNTHGKVFGGPLEKLPNVAQATPSLTTQDIEFSNSLVQVSTEGEGNGVVSRTAIDQYKASLPEKNQRELIYHVYQVMSKPVKVLEASNSLAILKQAFARYPFSSFPIVNSYRQIYSQVTRESFFNFLVNQPAQPLQRSIQETPELLATEVISTAPVTDVRRAAQIMVERQTPSIPVVDPNGTVLGIVAKRDILSCLAKDPPLSVWC